MKRFRLLAWCWWSYFKPSKENTRFKLRFILMLFLSISLLQIFENFSMFWVMCFIFVLASLMYFPKLIFIGVLLFIIAFIALRIINLHNIIASAHGNYKVKSTLSIGPVIKINGQRVLVISKKIFNKGDLIYVDGIVEPITNSDKFNLKQYLNTKWIDNVISMPQVHLYAKNSSWLNYIRNYIYTGPLHFRTLAPLLLLGKKTHEAKELFEAIKKISIVHLFVISGFHIGILYKVLSIFMKKIKIKNFEWITIVLIIPYILLLNWSIPSLRAILFISVLKLKEKLNTNWKSMDILAFVAISFFIINPYNINSFSYILTFITTIVIVYINSFKCSKIIKFLLINLFVFLVTLPIIVLINKFIPMTGPIFSIIFTPIMSFAYIVSIFLLPFKFLLEHLFDFLSFLLIGISKISWLILAKPFNKFGLLLYYVLFTFCFCLVERVDRHFYIKTNLIKQIDKK